MSLSSNVIKREHTSAVPGIREFEMKPLEPGLCVEPQPEAAETSQVLQDTALKEAYERGYGEGCLRAREELARAKGLFTSALGKLDDAERDFLRSADKELAALAVAVAGRILAKEVAADKDAVTRVCARALEMLAGKRVKVIRANPEDLPVLQAAVLESADLTAKIVAAEFAADDTIERGGCIIESESGSVDADIRTQLQVMEETFTGEHDGRAG